MTETVTTYVSDVRITDRDRVNEIIRSYRFPVDMEVFTVIDEPTLRIVCDATHPEAFTTADKNTDDEPIGNTLAWTAFLADLTGVIHPSDTLVIQVVVTPNGNTNTPLTGVEWVISRDGVEKTAFTVGDSHNYPLTTE